MQVVLINLLLPYLPKSSGPLKAPKPGLKPKGENVRGDRLMGENGSGETIGESGDTGTRLTAALGGGGLGDCGQQVNLSLTCTYQTVGCHHHKTALRAHALSQHSLLVLSLAPSPGCSAALMLSRSGCEALSTLAAQVCVQGSQHH